MKALVQEDVRHGLRIAPLIDVVFLLLVFFLVATTFYDEERDLSLSLASSRQSDPSEKVDSAIINIRADGDIMVKGRIVRDSALVSTLSALAGETAAAGVVIRCDRHVQHERFITVLDACQMAGIQKLSVATRLQEHRGL